MTKRTLWFDNFISWRGYVNAHMRMCTVRGNKHSLTASTEDRILGVWDGKIGHVSEHRNKRRLLVDLTKWNGWQGVRQVPVKAFDGGWDEHYKKPSQVKKFQPNKSLTI